MEDLLRGRGLLGPGDFDMVYNLTLTVISHLQLEDGDYLLMESGDTIACEFLSVSLPPVFRLVLTEEVNDFFWAVETTNAFGLVAKASNVKLVEKVIKTPFVHFRILHSALCLSQH